LSVLTKVFVVLVTFLSIMLVALIVPFVAKTEDFRAKLQTAESAKSRAEAAARNRESEISQLQSGESERFTALQAKIRSLTETITNLTQSMADQKGRVQDLEADKSKRDADFSRLTAANEQFGQINKTLQDELADRRKETVDDKTRIIETVDRNNELESQLESLTRSVRQFQEKATELEGEKDRLEKMLAKLPPSTLQALREGDQAMQDGNAVVTPSHPISGQVTKIQVLGTDTWVQVNVGRNDGVEQNMKFMVHRGGQFLGSTMIMKVDTDESAGRMVLTIPGAEVTVGDAVLTGDVSAAGNM